MHMGKLRLAAGRTLDQGYGEIELETERRDSGLWRVGLWPGPRLSRISLPRHISLDPGGPAVGINLFLPSLQHSAHRCAVTSGREVGGQMGDMGTGRGCFYGDPGLAG